MAKISGQVNTLDGAIGKIKADINVYKGTESESTIVSVNNRTKEITVDVKEDYIQHLIDVLSIRFQVVDVLPDVSEAEEGIIYLVPSDQSGEIDYYNEYIYIKDESRYECIGSTQITFDEEPIEGSKNAITSGGVYNALQDKVDKDGNKGLSSNDFTDEYKDKLNSIQIVEANTGEVPTETLTDLKVGNIVYEIPQGGSDLHLIAGIGIDITTGETAEDKVIAVADTVAMKTDIPSYTAGTGIEISAENEISVDTDTVALKSELFSGDYDDLTNKPDIEEMIADEQSRAIAVETELETRIEEKQDKLIAGENITIDENNVISTSGGSTVMVRDYADNEWSTKTWIGSAPYWGNDVWTDGEYVYYSSDQAQYVLDKSTSTWNVKSWNGLKPGSGRYIWTDGVNIYYSAKTNQYVLDRETSTWNIKTWNGLTNFYGSRTWTDGENIYYSSAEDEQYVLDVANSTWNIKIWNGYIPYLNYIWSDGENVYYSRGEDQYILNKSTSTWIPKTWNGLTDFTESNIWTHKGNIYCGKNWILDKTTSTWNKKVWNNLNTAFWLSGYVWTDGDYTYYSYNSDQLVLDDTSTHTATILAKVAETGDYDDLDNIPPSGIDVSSQEIEDYFDKYCNIHGEVTEELIEGKNVNILDLDNVELENNSSAGYVALDLNSDNVSAGNKILNIE